MKAIEQCFGMGLVVMLHKEVLTFKSVDETLKLLFQIYFFILKSGNKTVALKKHEKLFKVIFQGGSNFLRQWMKLTLLLMLLVINLYLSVSGDARSSCQGMFSIRATT